MPSANILPNQPFERHGDKENSDFFEKYLLEIYEDRNKTGITDNIGDIHSIYIQIDPETAREYIAELSLMTMYNYVRSWEYKGFRYHLLRISDENPDFLVLEPIEEKHDVSWAMNHLSPNGPKKPFTRYLGEVLWVEDLKSAVKMQEERKVRFLDEFPKNPPKNYTHWTEASIYTWNHTGYRQKQSGEKQYDKEKAWKFPNEAIELFTKMKTLQADLEIPQYLMPIDHLATRVFMHDREHALLEFLQLSSYYYWGSYNIGDQNSSTNICRSTKSKDERISPAKVFTANNTPWYTCHIDNLPSPTENFVRDFGRRMHHIAHGVKDGFIGPEEKNYRNVDFVVDQLQTAEKEFLLHVIGTCEEGLKQIFSKKSKYSWLITEYIQRCYDFEGFFTKENVAALTEAAGHDDMIT